VELHHLYPLSTFLGDLHPLGYIGILLLCGYAGGKLASYVKAPRVSGYLVVGMLLSPSLLGVFDEQLVKEEELKGPSPLIERLKLKLKKGEKAGELEAMSIGMDLERKAVDFFKKSSRKATDPKAKQIFDEICEEEKLHYVLLQAQYDSVTNNGCWLDVAEFRMDGKF